VKGNVPPVSVEGNPLPGGEGTVVTVPGTPGVFPGTIGTTRVVLPGTTGVVPGTVEATTVVLPGTTGVFASTTGVVPGTGVVDPGTTGVVPGTTGVMDPDPGTVPQVELVNTLLSNVTEAFLAKARPSTVALVLRVIAVKARMLPTKEVLVPRVADEPTCQNTLHACAPPVRTTELPEPVMSVLPAWKMNTEAESPLRVSGRPFSAIELEAV
jgi:hypothetical protein